MEESDDSMFSEVGNFISQNEKLHDVYFLVGDEKERIGALRLLLINQSRVWWSMLSPESPLVETADIHLPDIEPATFKLLLKHCYAGLDDLQGLSEDTVVQLCYCANKYLMASLTKKIEARLQPADVNQLFAALYCLTHYNLHGVKEAVTKIVQTKTKRIFAHPKFLKCDVDSIVFIAQQDKLSCKELELWRAIVDWAKRKAGSSDESKLRQVMSEPLKHIRLLTLTDAELRQACSDGILNGTELMKIFMQDLDGLDGFCKNAKIRHPEKDITYKLIQTSSSHRKGTSPSSISCIVIKDQDIFLQSLTCRNTCYLYSTSALKNVFTNFKVNINLTISRITNRINNTSNEDPVVIKLNDLEYPALGECSIPTVSNDNGVLLKANSLYKIELKFHVGCYQEMLCWDLTKCESGHDFGHGIFHCSLTYIDGKGTTPCHILQFNYSVADG